MNLRKTGAAVAAALVLAVAFPAAAAAQQKFPSKPIRMLVPFTPGSQTDILARWIGEKITDNSGHQVVVDNRPSAGGTIASEYVLAANPDGHTLMMVSTGHAGNATMYSKLSYDTIKDFSGISRVASVPNLLVVTPALGPKTVKDLVEYAKARPGKINFSSAGIGSGTQINGEMFKLAAGMDATHVPYKGAPESLNNVISGSVHFTFTPILVAMGQVKAGRVLVLAVSTAKRSAMFPDVPTVAEAGIPGFDYDQWYGVLASAKTPRPLVKTVNQEIVRILNLPDMKERLLTQGAAPSPTTPEEFDAFIRSEVKRFAKVLIAAGARIN
ncbi:MAG TPA: tripartite tricarboxylate transporter substrate binding protein [Burkholderiales bacterium]|nr:tripartite tricarboxylate transporter substrate binding protein [Burkholderiales bacterium]